ncbi:MAG: CDP-alcohol phosphatidyltransferase family protein [Bacteroidota bacterium]
MNIKKHIPNAITCCNLFCGCLAIIQAFEGNLVNAAYLVSLALIFDFFDGFAARMLRVASPIGKDLDSLADMVTFGVVPGLVMFQLHKFSLLNYVERLHGDEMPSYFIVLKYSAFIITIFSAVRLAKFNNDIRQTDSFIGVPTPAVAIFILSIAFVLSKQYYGVSDHEGCAGGGTYAKLLNLIADPHALFVISVILSVLLVSEIPLFALKFKFFGWRGNRVRYTFLALSLLLIGTLQFVGIPLIIILYILMSVITNFYMKRRTV